MTTSKWQGPRLNPSPLVSNPAAAGDHKLGGWKQHRWVLLRVRRPESGRSLRGSCSRRPRGCAPRRVEGTVLPLPVRGAPASLPHVGTWGDMGPTWVISHLKFINLITSAEFQPARQHPRGPAIRTGTKSTPNTFCQEAGSGSPVSPLFTSKVITLWLRGTDSEGRNGFTPYSSEAVSALTSTMLTPR